MDVDVQCLCREGYIALGISSDDWQTKGVKIRQENVPFKAKGKTPFSEALVKSIGLGCHVWIPRYELTYRAAPDVVSKRNDQELTNQHDVLTSESWTRWFTFI